MRTQIRIGNSLVQDGLASFDCWKSRLDPVDILEFSFRSGVQLDITDAAPTEFHFMDPSGTLQKVFQGQVDIVNSPYRARDKAVDFMKLPVYQTFFNVTPQEMILFALKRCGNRSAFLTPRDFPRKDAVSAAPNGFELVKQINRLWGTDYDPYFDEEEVFHWHELLDQKTMPLLAYGSNIISLEFDGTKGSLVTIGMPSITHSSYIGINHPDVPVSEALVDTVHHYTVSPGGIRTEVYFSIPA
ncbi:MAG: hypothetical protein QMC95_06560 [Desulfitobacteriaceae bacterium]|nr:hypothetical protein [Desulfitobacteriaceae bacterium]